MKKEDSSRQGFLGTESSEQIANCSIAIVGLGGGGSHIVQQLAHVGFKNYVLFDPDKVERHNLNRLIGGTLMDAEEGKLKVEVAARLIRSLNPDANIETLSCRWQEEPSRLRKCNIVFGGVDSFSERRDLEVATRRYLIPLIDIGLDVAIVGGEPPQMAGQVILSMPGYPCMECMGFLTNEKLKREAANYGSAGPRPQVVWANGVLASTAVGIAVDLVTDWTQRLRGPLYLSYEANLHRLGVHPRMQAITDTGCSHFQKTGDPIFRSL